MSSLDHDINNLRLRARKLLELKGRDDLHPPAHEDIQDAMRLLEELRVYQTELEIQNQDLRNAQQTAEAALHKYRRLFEHMPIPGVIVDKQGFIVEGNIAARTQFGLHQRTAMQRRSLYQLFDISSRSSVYALLTSQRSISTATDCTVLRKDTNTRCTVDLHTLLLTAEDAPQTLEGLETQRLILMVDRTAEWLLKAKQSTLLETEAHLLVERNRLSGILEGTRAGTWEWNLEDDALHINPRWASILGYALDELQPLTLEKKWSFVHNEDAIHAKAQLAAHIRGEKDYYESELRLLSKDGGWIWGAERARIIERDDNGKPLQVAGTLIDITESITLRERIRAGYELLTNLARQIPGVIYQYQLFPDGHSCFPYASEGIEQIYEVRASDVVHDASAVFALLYPDDVAAVVESIQISASTLQPWVCEYRVQLPKQGVRWRSGTAQPEQMPDGSILWHGFITDITDHRNAEERLMEFNRDFVAFLEQTSDFIYFKDRSSRFRFCSQALATMCGFGHWKEMLGKNDLEVFPPETAFLYQEEDAAVLQDGQPILNKIDPYRDANGNSRFVQINKWPLLDADGKIVGIFGINRDVTESIHAQVRSRLAASMFANAREAIMITDPTGVIVEVNDSFCRMTGYTREDAMGQNPRILRSGRQTPDFYQRMWSDIVKQGFWSGEIWNRRKNGEIYAELKTISAIKDEWGNLKNYVGLATDITTLKEHQRELEHVAHYDSLTGLPNRLLFSDRLEQAMHRCECQSNSLCVVYIDLDGFKLVNDTYGHAAGDALLVTLSQRMQATLREGDSLARMGGDEFVAVLIDLDEQEECLTILNRLLSAASEPVWIHSNSGSVQTRVSASIGATVYPRDSADADLLLRHADQAMYLAKQAGKNRCHLFDVEHDAAVKSQREICEQIQRALQNDEFELYYQPKVNLVNFQIVGFEALIRWNRPDGIWMPGQFLPSIEHNTLSIHIGEWVISTALRQLQQWHSMGLALQMSVNVGAIQLQHPDFVSRLESLLQPYPASIRCNLDLEVLESSALGDMDAMAEKLRACTKLGVSFSLDDFGTGYSSLGYLKHLPTSTLKIDQAFIRDMLEDSDDRAIVNAIIGLAKSFGRTVIAEGVETQTHADQLLAMGCYLVQGYGIARPMPTSAVLDWIANWKKNPINVMEHRNG